MLSDGSVFKSQYSLCQECFQHLARDLLFKTQWRKEGGTEIIPVVACGTWAVQVFPFGSLSKVSPFEDFVFSLAQWDMNCTHLIDLF